MIFITENYPHIYYSMLLMGLDIIDLLSPPKKKIVNVRLKQAAYKQLKTENENLLLRQILADSPNPIRVTTKKNNIIYVNPAWEELTGYLFEEVKGKNASFLQSGKTAPSVYKKMLKSLQNNIPFTTEDVIDRRKDGSEYRIFSSTYPVHSSNNTTFYVQMHWDITTRKKREAVNHQLASLVQFSNDAILGISPEMKFTSWNPAAKKMYGYSEKEIIGKSVTKIIPKQLLGEERQLLMDNPVLCYQTKRLRKDGKLINVLITTSPVKDKRGKIIGYSAIHHDITEHLRITDKLIENEKQFRAIFSSMFQFTELLSPDGTLIEANKTALSFISAKNNEVAGKLFWNTPWWSFSKEIQKQLKASIKYAGSGKFIKYETTNMNEEGCKLTLDFSLTPIKNEQDKVFLIIAEGRDITDRKILEQQKNTFLSIASHELKTPVTILKLMIEVFIRKFRKRGIETKEIEIINKELDRLTDLMKKLLDITRIDSGKMHLEMENTNLTALIENVIQKMNLVAGNRKIIFAKTPECTVFCDVNRIGEVLTNFISNAIKYSHNNTTITIQLKTNKNNVVVSVNDQGFGISGENLLHVFDKYYQANERSKGFGLGLFISKEIIMKHKGKIWAKSTPGKGSTFFFSLPLIK